MKARLLLSKRAVLFHTYLGACKKTEFHTPVEIPHPQFPIVVNGVIHVLGSERDRAVSCML